MAVIGLLRVQTMLQVLVIMSAVLPALTLVTPGCHSLWVQLESWSGNGRDSRGDRCDPIFRRACDPYFYICVDYKTPQDGTNMNRWSGTNMASCDYSGGVQRTKEYDSKNSVTFGTGTNALRSGLSNPLKYNTVTRPWQQARVYIKIEDNDIPDGDDLIDEHMFDLNGLNLDNTGNVWAYPFSESVVAHNWIPKTDTGTYYSRTNSRMTIKYKVMCCPNYHNFDCSVFCVAQNSPHEGYYTCDPMTGDKVCRDGYMDPTTTPSCITRIDACSSHTCNNWCDSSPCQNGATCNLLKDGYKCECNIRFYGLHCRERVENRVGTEMPSTDKPDDDDGLPIYIYFIIVAVVLILIIVVMAILWRRDRRRRRSDEVGRTENNVNENRGGAQPDNPDTYQNLDANVNICQPPPYKTRDNYPVKTGRMDLESGNDYTEPMKIKQ